jgi:ClpP class serine protease
VLALGFAVRDLVRPHAGAATRLPREWEGELALRPLGTDRLEAAIAGRIEQGVSARVRPRARLAARVARGLTLFGELDTTRDERDALLAAPAEQTKIAWSALFGATVNIAGLGLTGAGIVNGGQEDLQREPGPGASFVLRTFPGRRLPLVEPRHVERVRLAGLENDGQFLERVVTLRRLADDPTVGAVLLEIGDLQLGPGRIEELRGLVTGIRQRKPVFAQVVGPSLSEYYLAAACDRIVVHPAGTVGLMGLAQTVTFYKSAMDKLGVQVQLVRIAEYKGAMEPFVMTEQSEPVRQNRNAVLDDNYSRMMGAIAAGRVGQGLSVESLPAMLDRAVFSAGEAKQQGLVDEVADEKETEGYCAREPGAALADHPRVGRALPAAALDAGAGGGGAGRRRHRRQRAGWAALLHRWLAFADRIIEAIDHLRDDGSVKAVVLRVNSPGGSALASDRIARGRDPPARAQAGDRLDGRPGGVGGYYVSARPTRSTPRPAPPPLDRESSG